MEKKSLHIALVGNPNTGKSTLFNGLTGLKQKVGNYPGVTVERKTGQTQIDGITHTIIDLPGTYSLNPKSLDEKIAYQTLIGENKSDPIPDLVIVLVDATNLDRNLYLATQVIDLGLPVIIALNMIDLAAKKGQLIDVQQIQNALKSPVISIVAKDNSSIEITKNAIANHDLNPAPELLWKPDFAVMEAIGRVKEEWLKPHTSINAHAHTIEALRILGNSEVKQIESNPRCLALLDEVRQQLTNSGINWMAVEVLQRYNFISEIAALTQENEDKVVSKSDKVDQIVTHKVWGPIIFVVVLMVMFQSIFSWANPFMDFIDWAFIEMGGLVTRTLPEGMFRDLLVDGVIAGLGGVVIFLPQIMFLFFFISILESTGYMSRAAFVMDGFMTRIGLHGRSVVPLMSGFACAIPGIMATRTIENWKDRLITIMVVPFMACSARLPVYALMIAAFIPSTYLFGFIPLQGLTFFGLYFFGIVMAILAALIMKLIFKSENSTPFIMELPSYKWPKWSLVIQNMFERGWIFVKEAGKVIMAISIILWFLATFPSYNVEEQPLEPGQTIESAQLRNSYAGQIGQLIEPVVQPLGFDWKIGISLITSFAAREVMVGTLNTIYSIEDDSESMVTLKQKLINDKTLEGKPVYSTLTAISLMIFFALAMQCMSTIAIVKRETNSWKWAGAMFVYMTGLAYICSLAIFQIGTALGY